MDLGLTDQHVLITGGSRGIGLACARGFLAEGARVTLVARQQTGLDSALSTLIAEGIAAERLQGRSADLTDAEAAADLVAQVWTGIGPVDVLVNSAGAARRSPPAELSAAAWQDAMSAKYFTTIHVLDPVIKQMAARGRGAVVNVIGAGGKFASPTHLPGGSANAALMLATAGLAQAYAAQGVRVNGVSPGATLTDRLKGGLEAQARLEHIDLDTAMARAVARTALGRLAEPAEIADAVVFLASRRASYITGVTLLMDGGGSPTVL